MRMFSVNATLTQHSIKKNSIIVIMHFKFSQIKNKNSSLKSDDENA